MNMNRSFEWPDAGGGSGSPARTSAEWLMAMVGRVVKGPAWLVSLVSAVLVVTLDAAMLALAFMT